MMVSCFRCDAVYDPAIQWVYGWWDKNSTVLNNFHRLGSIKLGDCPICRQPPLLEKPVQYTAAM
jgi:hypothetical protein